MTDTDGEGKTATGGALSVLLVDDDRRSRGAILAYVERDHGDLRVAAEADGAAALDRLASESFDCLVTSPDAPGVDGASFVAEVRAVVEDCPVVWLTRQSRESLDDDALAAATTVVEKGEDPGNWSFLVGKVRGAVRDARVADDPPAVFETLVETARDGLYTLDANGEITYANPAFAELLGYDQEELVGMHAARTMAAGELGRGQAVVEQLLEAEREESDLMDVELVRKDGEQVDVAIHFAVLTGADGTYRGLTGVVRDVTERKARERQLERQRARLDEFASVVSHDLRSPLGVARGRITLAAAECECERGAEHVSAAVDALDRMERLVDDLLELARQGRLVEEPEPVALESVVDRAWTAVAPGGDLQCDLGDATVRGDRDRLIRVFENLFRNAVEHAGADATVRVGRLADDRGFYVEDDGPGIPESEREAVFDRGYTTGSGGTGYGLSIVRNVVDAHGWSVAVTDGLDGGARFEVTGAVLVDPGETSPVAE